VFRQGLNGAKTVIDEQLHAKRRLLRGEGRAVAKESRILLFKVNPTHPQQNRKSEKDETGKGVNLAQLATPLIWPSEGWRRVRSGLPS